MTDTIEVAKDIPAPQQAVWDRVSNHAQTHTWVKAARVRLLEEGRPSPNGLGALREVSFPDKRFWSTIQERIVSFEPPHIFTYKIVSNMPGLRDHLGALTVTPLDASRSRLVWHVDFDFKPWHPMAWFAGAFTKTFGGVLAEALEELARQMSGQQAPVAMTR